MRSKRIKTAITPAKTDALCKKNFKKKQVTGLGVELPTFDFKYLANFLPMGGRTSRRDL